MPELEKGKVWTPRYGVGDTDGIFEGISDLSGENGFFAVGLYFREQPYKTEGAEEVTYAKVEISTDEEALVADYGYTKEEAAAVAAAARIIRDKVYEQIENGPYAPSKQ